MFNNGFVYANIYSLAYIEFDCQMSNGRVTNIQ